MSGERGGSSPRRHTMFSRPARAALATLIAMSIAMSGVATMALADTTAETSVSVVVVNSGSLDVHWESTELVFSIDGDSRGPTAAEGVSATTTLLIAIHDTRADSVRAGYDITLSASDFSADDSGAVIDPERLMVSDIAGLPTNDRAQRIVGTTLETPVTLLPVGCDQPAIDTTLAVTVRMIIPAGARPGSYAGKFFLDVIPAASCGL